MTYPDGFYITYGYDTVGDLTGEFENGGSQITGFSYDSLGRRATLTRGNAVTTSYSYDGASRLATLTQALSSPYNNSISFTYNAAGQIDTRTSTSTAFSPSAPTGVIGSYGADGLNRYASASGFTPTYGDGRGNLTGDGTRTYGYDSDNRLTSASGRTTLAYVPASRLASVVGSAGTTQFLYDGSDVIAEYDGSATPDLLRRYVHGPGVDEPLVWYEGTGTTNRHWLLADERGSVIAVTDGGGTVTQVDKYNADGAPDSGNNGRFQFTGQMWIAEAAVYHFKARAYHPGLGRFLQTDPSGFAGGLNLYAYAGNDPVNGTDPTGLDDQAPGGTVPVWGTRDPCWPAGPLEPLEGNLAGSCYSGSMIDWLNAFDGFGGQAPPLGPVNLGGAGPGTSPSQNQPCPSAAPLSKNNMAPAPFTDDNGNPILGPDGNPMMRPAGFDPHFFTAAGADDAAKYGPGTFVLRRR
jgi:RHS repeat-associated protein